jgi:hypothetical protein
LPHHVYPLHGLRRELSRLVGRIHTVVVQHEMRRDAETVDAGDLVAEPPKLIWIKYVNHH